MQVLVAPGTELSPLEQLERVAAPVPNELLAVARHDDDHRLRTVDWLAAALTHRRFLFAAHGISSASAPRGCSVHRPAQASRRSASRWCAGAREPSYIPRAPDTCP